MLYMSVRHNEYLGLDPKFGYWRDTHLGMDGDAVKRLQAQFILDWSIAAPDTLLSAPGLFPAGSSNGSTAMQNVASGPVTVRQHIKNALIKLLFEAKERIYLQTPYLVPDDSLFNALKVAIQSGVDVRIMIPRKGDSRFVQWPSNAYLTELLRIGAKCYFYEKGFLHAKMIVVDQSAGEVVSLQG